MYQGFSFRHEGCAKLHAEADGVSQQEDDPLSFLQCQTTKVLEQAPEPSTCSTLVCTVCLSLFTVWKLCLNEPFAFKIHSDHDLHLHFFLFPSIFGDLVCAQRIMICLEHHALIARRTLISGLCCSKKKRCTCSLTVAEIGPRQSAANIWIFALNLRSFVFVR